MTSPSLSVVPRSSVWLSRARDYVQLTRPRISIMVVVVVAVTGYVASRGDPDGRLLARTMLGTFLVAASASACNQLLERRRDRLMNRTARRPLPSGRLGFAHALGFTVLTALGGLAYLAWTVNGLTAAWGAATWCLYVGVYTPLKVRTPWNTAVGAVVGAIPVCMGWSAVGGTANVLEDPRGCALFLVQFLWQFPHFMAIAWMYRQQYERAGMRMWSVVDPTGRLAGLHAVAAAAALLPVSAVPLCVMRGGPAMWYLIAALVLGLGQLRFALGFLAQRTDRSARLLLRATLLYLPLLLLALVLATAYGRAGQPQVVEELWDESRAFQERFPLPRWHRVEAGRRAAELDTEPSLAQSREGL
jgi:heme o synthase